MDATGLNYKKGNRNEGLDLLKFISMAMVVMLHILGQGGVIDGSINLTANNAVAWFYESLSYCAVDVFVLITGVIYVNVRYKLSNLIYHWFQVVSYALAITLGLWVLRPGSVTLRDVFHAVTPVTSGLYWFFSVYFVLFLIIPILNTAVEHMEEDNTKKTLILMTVFLSVLPTVFQNDNYGLGNEYSYIWFIYLYLLGATEGKYKYLQKISKIKLLMVFFGALIVLWASVIGILNNVIPSVSNHAILLRYVSPLVLIMAISMVGIFSNIRVNKAIKKLANFVGPHVFAVYLIHANGLVFGRYLEGKLGFIAQVNFGYFIIAIPLIAFLTSVVCVLVDVVRMKIFELLKIKKLSQKIGNFFQREDI